MRSAFVLLFSAILAVGTLACSRTRSASYQDAVQNALEQADLKDVKVDENVDKNTITLGGTLHSEEAKQKAAQVAQSAAGERVIANQISVEPVGVESDARAMESNVDDAIEKNYKAALIANGLAKQNIRYAAKNGVLTLKGSVKVRQQREKAQQIATSVPNVEQVVNQIQINR